MLRFEDQDVLSVTRFDRRWIGTNNESVGSPTFIPGPGIYIARLPQEDLCQAFGLPYEKKYENKGGPSVNDIIRLLSNSENETEDKASFVLAQLLFWLLAAPDGHAKNFSLQYTAGGGFRLTPLYDVLSAWPLIDRGPRSWQYEKVKLAMAVRSKNPHYRLQEIQARHWKGEADKTGIATLWDRMIDVVERAPETFESIEARLPEGFPTEVFVTMRDGMKRHAQDFKRGRAQ
jgi:serine/threonine-protein kinase HipA